MLYNSYCKKINCCVLSLESGNLEETQLQSTCSLKVYDFFMIIGELNNCTCKKNNRLLFYFLETWKS